MAAMDTGDLEIPDQILDPWLGKVQGGSTVATLSGSIPMKFGQGHTMTFDIGEAEYVGEGANKGPSTVVPTVRTVKPFKFHKTVRMTEEVKWADEDHQLKAVEQVLSLIQPSLSRALDFGVFHGINPASGATVVAMTETLSDADSVAASGEPYEAIDDADRLVLANSCIPSDIALDPLFAAEFATSRTTDGIKRYPELSMQTAASVLEGHRASVSRTVSASGVSDDSTGIFAFVGDFSAIQWGVQRRIGLELIEYGDPDGQGDLKRNNQIAFRAEVVYGWGIANIGAFAVITDPSSS